jgi:MFS family permease
MPFGPKQVGYTWALAGFFGIFWQGPALGKMAKRFGEALLNRAGFLGYVVGYLILAFCQSIAQLGAATAVMSMGSLVRPALTSLITQATSREEQGVVLGLTQSLTSVSLIIGPLVSGYLIEHELLTAWGLSATVIALLGLVLAMRPAPRAGD